MTSHDPGLDALAEPLIMVPEEPATPPEQRPTPRQWIRANLFSTRFNSVLTIVVGCIVAWIIYRAMYWVLVTAEWRIVRVNLRLFMVGRFPTDQFGRLWGSLAVLTTTMGVALGGLTNLALRRRREAGLENGEDETGEPERATSPSAMVTRAVSQAIHRFWPLLLAVVVSLGFTRTPLPFLLTVGLVGIFLAARFAGTRLDLSGGAIGLVVAVGLFATLTVVSFGESGVGWDDWGGLYLSVFATVAGIALAFPLGLIFALGRRSSLPATRMVSIGFIELFRAVPLVTLLFMGEFMVGMFLPTWMDAPSRLARAIIAITLFQSAYIAEIVRGGLQSIPRGQVEAAQAIGLPPTRVMRFVVLPQALRAVIPAMVGQFISLFKDTSLLAILSFPDLLWAAETAPIQDQFRGQGLKPVTLAFAAFLYWAGCSTMARESRRLEHRLGVGER